MKVLFFITKSNWGGAQRYVYDLATNFPPGCEPVVMLGGEGELKTKLIAANIRVISIPGLQRDISFRAELAAGLAIYRIIKAERPAVLHVNSSKAGGLGALIGRVNFVPRVIFTAHGWAFNEDRPIWQQFIIKALHWLTVLLSHHAIAVSDAIRRDMNWPFVQHKLTVVHNGRDHIPFMSKEAARSELATITPALASHQHELWTGTIAELHPVKRHDVMIEAVARLRGSGHTLRHVIIGTGQQMVQLQALVNEKELTEHVFFTGAIHEAARLLPAFDIFTLTSRSEALGYTAVEAAQAGLPIVASNVGGLPEVVTNNTSGLLIEPKPEPIANAIRTLIEAPALREQFGNVARDTAAKKFSLETMLQKTFVLYSVTMPRDWN